MVVLGTVTAGAGKLWPPRALPEHVESPILAIELLRPGVPLGSFVWNNERQDLTFAVKLDFAFIAAYTLFLLLVGALARGPIRRALGVAVIVGALVGAVFDVLENIRMLDLLRDPALQGPTTLLPRGPSVVKWWSLFLASAAMAVLTVDRRAPPFRRWIGYVSTIVAIVAAAGGIFGLCYGNDTIIEAAVGRLAIAWFLAYVFVASEQALRDGLRAALDRLAARPWLRRIAEWPDTDSDEDTVGPPLVEPSSLQ